MSESRERPRLRLPLFANTSVVMSNSLLKENRPPKKKTKHGRDFSLSPLKKPANEILNMKQNDPQHVELRQLGTEALSLVSARQIVNENKAGVTICAWPQGMKTNQHYKSLLAMKDAYDVFFFLLQSSPRLCIFDATKFLFHCLDHFVIQSIAKEINEGFAPLAEFLGRAPSPFEHAWQVNYLSYKRWIDCLESGDVKINHFVVLRRAEVQLRDMLVSHGYDLSPEQVPFEDWLRNVAEVYDSRLRPERNATAHLFCDLLLHNKSSNISPSYSLLPLAKPSSLLEENELAKKAVALEALKSSIPKMGRDGMLYSVAIKMIEVFLMLNVERAREVIYGESIVLLPGKLPPNAAPIHL